MMLIISVCKEKLHEKEFVLPVVNVVKELDEDVLIVHYKDLTHENLEVANKAIVCGTSLKDFDYLNNLEEFSWVREFDKPLLGICAGMQVIGLNFGSKTLEEKHIGAFREKFNCEQLNFMGEKEVYFLHNKAVNLPPEFMKLNLDLDYPTFFKHSSKETYGVLFHPEVYKEELIENFIKL